jgi:hypothetical protein
MIKSTVATKQDMNASLDATKQDMIAVLNAKLDGILKQLDSLQKENVVPTNNINNDQNNVTDSSGIGVGIDDNAMMQRALLNNPPIPPTAGTLTNTTNITPFTQVKPTLKKHHVDGEDYDMIHHYFWGQENGIVMELGALDGDKMSMSKAFLKFNWHRILVEANPQWAQQGPQASPNATYVHAAICDPNINSKGVVHYLRRGGGSINGIAEFMSTSFMKQFHGQFYTATQGGTNMTAIQNWTAWSSEPGREIVDEVPCLDINSIFKHLGLTKINWFMLDVEGGELNILQGVDFDRIIFDVLIVETEPNNPKYRPPGYAQKVIDFLLPKGYIHDRHNGRNSWFHHHSFIPIKDPAII